MEIARVLAKSAAFAHAHGVELPVAGSCIELEPARDGGAYGDIHAVVPEPTAVAPSLVAKVLFEDAVDDLGGSDAIATRLGELQHALERRGGAGWPEAVLALPFLVCTAELDGEQRLAMLMLDLGALGYEAAPFAERGQIAAYRGRSPEQRLDVALRYLERAAVLERVGFVHADQNTENLMFAPATGDVQIVDFDAGVVVETGTERPWTPGKPDGCMPPEVKTTDPRRPFDLSAYGPAAERWSVGSLAGQLLHGAHPVFFLRAISRQAIEEYAASAADWPEIDVDGPLFTPEQPIADYYAAVLPELRATPDPVRELIVQMLAAGLDGARRPRASDWVDGLRAARQPPEFEDVTIDAEIVVESEQVVVTWHARNADHVELPELGVQPAAGRASLVVDRTRRFVLTAVNAYGRTEASTPVVRAVALPRIETIALPRFPGFALSAVVSIEGAPARPPISMPSPLPRPPSLGSLRAAIPSSPSAGLRIPKGPAL